MSVILIYDLASHFRSYYHLIGDLYFKSLKITIIILINKPLTTMAVQNRRLFHLQYSLKEYGAHQSMRSAVCLRVDQSTHNSVVY